MRFGTNPTTAVQIPPQECVGNAVGSASTLFPPPHLPLWSVHKTTEGESSRNSIPPKLEKFTLSSLPSIQVFPSLLLLSAGCAHYLPLRFKSAHCRAQSVRAASCEDLQSLLRMNNCIHLRLSTISNNSPDSATTGSRPRSSIFRKTPSRKAAPLE